MQAKKLNELTKEELLEYIRKLKKQKKYGLVWESKPEKVVEQCKEELPVLEEVEDKAIDKDKSKPTNLIIEGDNYHALSVLNYTHAGKIDVIYIDPPYNTGARDWKYNNDYVDKNDRWRHSKWVAMMDERLKLARNLLNESGVLMVAIDDHEVHNLRHLMDSIMGETNYLTTLCVQVNPAGQNIRNNVPAISHDYCVVYARSLDVVELIPKILTEDEKRKFKEQDDTGNFLWDNLRRRGGNSTPADRPGQWYPLYYNPESKEISLKKFPNSTEAYPIDPKGIKRVWRVSPDGFEREYAKGNISVIRKAGRYEIVKKSYAPDGRNPKTLWMEGKHSATSHGTKLLIKILGKNTFTYPKSLYLVEDCLRYWSKPNSTILDFFAGSGTTGHAVLTLNREDKGNRKFILCTNNENKIAEEVCYPRIEKVIKGVKGLEKITNFSSNLKYFKTTFVPKSKVTDDTRRELVKKSVEMICVKEDSYKKLLEKPEYKVYEGTDHVTGILFNLDSLDDFKRELQKHKKEAHIYVFSLTNDTFDEDFEDLGLDHILCPIPESILEVYRKLFKN